MNRPSLSLHIPEPISRPGDPPAFHNMSLPAVGETRRPDELEHERNMRDLPYGLIRVLDDQGTPRGPWAPRIDPQVLLKGLRAMMLTRAFDERLFRAHRQGKTSFYMKSTGEEAISTAQSLLLGKGDMCFPTYRVLSWLMARDYPLEQLVNQIFSNEKDPLKGRQLPILYSARDYGFFSISGNLGTQLGQAVGWAMASAFKEDDKIALAYVGEGTTGEGDFHEAMTFASVYRAPALICITNNQWAISSFAGIAGANETTFAAKALGYGLPGLRVDGNDFLAVWAATEWAVERARANCGATLIEFYTYRAAGHSTSDDPTKYRPADEPEAWPLGDPVDRLKQHLIALGEWDETRHAALAEELGQQVRTSVKAGEAVGTLGKSKPSVREMFEGVFRDPDWRVIEQRRELGV
ncbi:2-oxoisovalerate dehydrogenase E1 component alpha subunit [Sphingobium sp. AP50]|uniref:thiamine pyrophosphate-dependent enzyme n=1 Tax=Sphingobium sp. AP50 TaxID=1884369 RepID=UPI0008B5B07F|nr:thiamine pyrophosphate-dependent enzyme [Sphingobium sp. AP50]SEJ98505.1 2-oxoisovalerate dehydrogenase E1 component alpha subunit [Sphingobium sp. AP50]